MATGNTRMETSTLLAAATAGAPANTKMAAETKQPVASSVQTPGSTASEDAIITPTTAASGSISKKSTPVRHSHRSSSRNVSATTSGPQQEQYEPIFASRDTADFKWQRAKQVVGALEVHSEPVFQPRNDMKPRYKQGCEQNFEEALQAWQDLKLRQSFIKACDELLVEACCCGLMHDADASIKQYVKTLNDGWTKTVNRKLQPRGLKVDIFLWNWQNASGKAETNIMLIRFFTLSTHKFRRASNQGSLDLDDILKDASLSNTNEDQDGLGNNSSGHSRKGRHGKNSDQGDSSKTISQSMISSAKGVKKQEMAR